MAALAAGVPGIFVAHDSRTDELIETMKLPHVAADKVPENIEQIFSLVEFDAQTFDDNRQNIRKQFGAALAKIGLQIEAVPNHISSPV
jgi:polysaccharide pyruvyl transferase WcaK-like protein